MNNTYPGPPIYWGGLMFWGTSVRPDFSLRPSIQFLWNFAWSCNFGQVRKWHSPIFEKKIPLAPQGFKRAKMPWNSKKMAFFVPQLLIHLFNFSETWPKCGDKCFAPTTLTHTQRGTTHARLVLWNFYLEPTGILGGFRVLWVKNSPSVQYKCFIYLFDH